MPYPELDRIGTIDGIIRPFQYEVVFLFMKFEILFDWFTYFINRSLSVPNVQVWILIVVSIAAIATFLRKILPLESFILKKNDHKKQLSLIDSFWSLFHFKKNGNVFDCYIVMKIFQYHWIAVKKMCKRDWQYLISIYVYLA